MSGSFAPLEHAAARADKKIDVARPTKRPQTARTRSAARPASAVSKGRPKSARAQRASDALVATDNPDRPHLMSAATDPLRQYVNGTFQDHSYRADTVGHGVLPTHPEDTEAAAAVVPETLIPELYHVFEDFLDDVDFNAFAAQGTDYDHMPRRLFPTRAPSSRHEVVLLERCFHRMLRDVPHTIDNFEKIRWVYSACFNEILRQVTVHMAERGRLLKDIWEGHLYLHERRHQHVLEVAKLAGVNLAAAGDQFLDSIRGKALKTIDRLEAERDAWKDKANSVGDLKRRIAELESQLAAAATRETKLRYDLDEERTHRSELESLLYRFGEIANLVDKTSASDKLEMDDRARWDRDATILDEWVRAKLEQREPQIVQEASAVDMDYVRRLERENQELRDRSGWLASELAKWKKAHKDFDHKGVQWEDQTEAPEAEEEQEEEQEKNDDSLPLPPAWFYVFGNYKGGGRPAARKSTLKLVNELLKLKLAADDACEAQHLPQPSIPEFLYGHYTNKFGLQGLAEQHLKDLLESLLVHKSHPRIHIMARFCGLFEPLSYNQSSTYLRAYRAVLKLHDGITLEERGEDLFIPLDRALGIAAKSFGYMVPAELAAFQSRVEALAEGGGGGSGGITPRGGNLNASIRSTASQSESQRRSRVHVDHFLAEIVSSAALETTLSTRYVDKLFFSADLHRRRSLSMTEYITVVRFCDPSCPLRQAMQLFLDRCGKDDERLSLDNFRQIAASQTYIASWKPLPRDPSLAEGAANTFSVLEKQWATNADRIVSHEIKMLLQSERSGSTDVAKRLTVQREAVLRALRDKISGDPEMATIAVGMLMAETAHAKNQRLLGESKRQNAQRQRASSLIAVQE